MKKKFLFPSTLLLLLILFSGCQAIGDIFKTGVGAGVFIVVIIIAIVLFVIGKSKK